MTKQKNVVDFKKYLSKDNPLTGKLYFGDIDHEVDQGLESALKALEKKISKATGSSIEGMLWTGGSINPEASVQDVKNSISLIVKAQATLDSIGPYREEEGVPVAMNFSNTPPGYIEEPDPLQSQRHGAFQQVLPGDLDLDGIDDRILLMFDLMNDKKD